MCFNFITRAVVILQDNNIHQQIPMESSLFVPSAAPSLNHNPQEPKDDPNSYRSIPLSKFEIIHNDSHKSSNKQQSTVGSRQIFVDLPSIISKDESITSMEKTTAKNKIHLLHGKRFGRSLTQEIELQEASLFNKKWVFIVMLLLLGFMSINAMLDLGDKKNQMNKQGLKARKAAKKKKKAK